MVEETEERLGMGGFGVIKQYLTIYGQHGRQIVHKCCRVLGEPFLRFVPRKHVRFAFHLIFRDSGCLEFC